MMMMNTEDCLTFHFLFSQCEPLNSSEIRVTLLLEGGKVETMMAKQTYRWTFRYFDILVYLGTDTGGQSPEIQITISQHCQHHSSTHQQAARSTKLTTTRKLRSKNEKQSCRVLLDI